MAMTWTCHVCGDVRTDEKISVHKTFIGDRWGLAVGTVSQNVRYCNDRPACREGAVKLDFPEIGHHTQLAEELRAVIKRMADAIQEAAGQDWRGGNVDTIHYLRSRARELDQLKEAAGATEILNVREELGDLHVQLHALKEANRQCLIREEKAYQERDRLYRLAAEEPEQMALALKAANRVGLEEGIRRYAWWKDGIQYVGTGATTLKAALEEPL